LQPHIDPAPDTVEPKESWLARSVRARRWLLAALCGITLLAYANSFGLGLALDAPYLVLKDPRIRTASAENLNLILHQEYGWPTTWSGLYRPVTTVSFLLNYAILGNRENAAGYHWVNFLLHLGNVWLVYALSLRLLKRTWPAFFAAALWAVHPIGTESVTNIAGRADELAAMAVLGGLLLYVRSLDMPDRRRKIAAMALFAIATAGVFSKENAAVLLGLMLLWDISFGMGERRQGVLRRVPAYAAAAASLALLWWVRRLVFAPLPLPVLGFLENPIVGAGFWAARLTAIKVIGLDLWLLVWPLHLTCDRSYNQIPLAGWPDPLAWLALVMVGAILAFALARHRKDRLIFFAAGFVAITLLPTSNLLFPIGSIMGERFLYLPSVGFAIAGVVVAYRLGRERLTTAVLAAVIALFAFRALARNYDWKDDLTLTSTDVRVAPHSFMLRANLADALFTQDPVRNIDRAIRESETAWGIVRSLPPELISVLTPTNLGAYYGAKGELMGGMLTAQGRALYRKSLAVLLRAREADRAREKKYDEDLLARGKPLTFRSGFQPTYWNLGLTYAKLGLNAEALEAYRHARSLNPAATPFYDAIPDRYLASGNPEQAAIALVEKTLVSPNDPGTMSALRDLYRKIPGGSCAIDYSRGRPALDVTCPRVRNDLCEASADLAQAFLEARNTDWAREIQQTAMERYACPAAPFRSVLPDGPAF
jgi:tetratricopeptide (TPR) repeat protein